MTKTNSFCGISFFASPHHSELGLVHIVIFTGVLAV